MWHRPVLTIGPHSNDEGSLKPFWRMLYDYNADLVLTGHEHSYARYAPLNREANGADSARGMRQIVVGTGGKGLTTSTPRRLNAGPRGVAGCKHRQHPWRAEADVTGGELQLAVRAGGRQELHRLRD